MPEVPVCVFCKLSIKSDEDQVPLERAPSTRFGEILYQEYVHARCHDQMATTKNSSFDRPN